ncbi:protein GLUTAMINE DUMPER 6-like [Lolium rigidum]|uniref:protein GLUTAMINE DUMPER 6-like n=1 Tax=Lolium rigidum TaxID=89674 RepID=UPI001F5C92DB|nr:protein GLUTAMINE DUMPER 6-like [Lolium rigidum]
MRNAAVSMAMKYGGASSSPVVVPAYGAGGAVQPLPFWSTPTPYLFIGFGIVMSLIAVALAVLLCSRRKKGHREEDQEVIVQAGMMSVRVLAPVDRESPKVVVVMAGDDAPSFLASATPLAFAGKVQRPYCQCHGGPKLDVSAV